MSVALPVCIKRTPFAREAVIKILQSSGRWSELQTADVGFDDHRVCHNYEAFLTSVDAMMVQFMSDMSGPV